MASISHRLLWFAFYTATSDFFFPESHTQAHNTDPCNSRCGNQEYCKADDATCVKHRKEGETCKKDHHQYQCGPGMTCRRFPRVIAEVGVCDATIPDLFHVITHSKCNEGNSLRPLELPSFLQHEGETHKCLGFSRCADICLTIEDCDLIVMEHGDLQHGLLYKSAGRLECSSRMSAVTYVRFIDPKVFTIRVKMASDDSKNFESGLFRMHEESEKDSHPYYEKPCFAEDAVDFCEIRYRNDLQGWVITGPHGMEINHMHTDGVPRANWTTLANINQHTGPVSEEVEIIEEEPDSIWADENFMWWLMAGLLIAAIVSLMCFLCGVYEFQKRTYIRQNQKEFRTQQSNETRIASSVLRTSETHSPSSSECNYHYQDFSSQDGLKKVDSGGKFIVISDAGYVE